VPLLIVADQAPPTTIQQLNVRIQPRERRRITLNATRTARGLRRKAALQVAPALLQVVFILTHHRGHAAADVLLLVVMVVVALLS
jgi:hypothetical protein